MAKMSEKMKQELKAEKAYNKKHKRMYRLTANDVIFNIFAYLLFGIFVIICIFPFYYIFINSISSPAAVTSKAVTFWPQGFSLETYKAVIEVKDIGQTSCCNNVFQCRYHSLVFEHGYVRSYQ